MCIIAQLYYRLYAKTVVLVTLFQINSNYRYNHNLSLTFSPILKQVQRYALSNIKNMHNNFSLIKCVFIMMQLH